MEEGHSKSLKEKLLLILVLSTLGIALLLFFLLPWPVFNVLMGLLYKPVTVNPYYLLIVGTDAVIESTVRTDVIAIAAIDHLSGYVIVTNIPRDLIYNGSKINSIYEREGIEGLKNAIGNLLHLRVNGHVIVNYDIFKYLGDKLGPVEIQITEPMKYYDTAQDLSIDFEPGIHLMDGEQLLAYVRYRRDALGDISRMERQKEVIAKLLERARKMSVLDLATLFSRIRKQLEMNLNLGEIVYMFSRIRKNLSLGFLSFPYMVAQDGSIVVDESRIEQYIDVLAKPVVKTTPPQLNILVINCSKQKNRLFITKTQSAWKSTVGFLPGLIVWEDIGLPYNSNEALILKKSSITKDLVKKTLNNVYSDRNFNYRTVSEMEWITDYYQIIQKLAENRIYPQFPFDAVVLVNE